MADMGIDERVMLSEEAAPSSIEQRKAVLSFFDAFARGDIESVKMMMPYLDQKELDVLVETGAWQKTVDGLYAIELECGASPDGDACVLAFFDVDGDQQPQMWYMLEVEGGIEFEAQPTPEDVMTYLMGTDLIAAWFAQWQVEQELALQPDVEVDWTSVDLDEGGSSSSSSFSGGGGGTSPGGISPGGGGRRKSPPARRPPGPGGGGS